MKYKLRSCKLYSRKEGTNQIYEGDSFGLKRVSSFVCEKGTWILVDDKSYLCDLASRETKALVLHLEKYSMKLRKSKYINYYHLKVLIVLVIGPSALSGLSHLILTIPEVSTIMISLNF